MMSLQVPSQTYLHPHRSFAVELTGTLPAHLTAPVEPTYTVVYADTRQPVHGQPLQQSAVQIRQGETCGKFRQLTFCVNVRYTECSSRHQHRPFALEFRFTCGDFASDPVRVGSTVVKSRKPKTQQIGLPARQAMVAELQTRMLQRSPAASHAKARLCAEKLEQWLCSSTTSARAYSDFETLNDRLRQLAVAKGLSPTALDLPPCPEVQVGHTVTSEEAADARQNAAEACGEVVDLTGETPCKRQRKA
jgi:hypothetical protein